MTKAPNLDPKPCKVCPDCWDSDRVHNKCCASRNLRRRKQEWRDLVEGVQEYIEDPYWRDRL